ncbi:hypothetical protein BKA82DRAFT_4132017 [Pisolithus tinctorius]|nr:hypothetical protein BKA82DRAFT_4132017 [Pisolithus tinctorius]
MFTTILTVLLAAVSITLIQADPTPIAPGPGDVFIESQSCSIAWSADPSGMWTTMNIYLMTGDNYNMIKLASVGTVNGADPTKITYSYPCPQVSPYAPIYFYEFSSPASTNLTWTTRFTITDLTSDIVPAPQPTQPGGANIPWGIGTIIGTSASSSDGVSSSTVSTTVSTATSSPTVSTKNPGVSPTDTTSATSTPVSITDSGVSPTDTSGVTSTPAPSTTSAATANGANIDIPSGLLWRAVFSIAVSIFGFAVIF